METFFKDMYNQIANMSPEELERMKHMVKDLNQMLQDKMAGKEPNFDQFMQQYGDLFGDNPPQSLDELVAQMQHQMGQMQSLMDSLPGDMRQQLQDLLCEKVGDPDCSRASTNSRRTSNTSTPCASCVTSTHSAAKRRSTSSRPWGSWTRCSRSMSSSASSSARSTAAKSMTSTPISSKSCSGHEARETLDQLKQFLEVLEEAGYIRKKGNSWELTPRGTRKIGQRALGEIYAQLKSDIVRQARNPRERHRRRPHRPDEEVRVRRSVLPGHPEDDDELHAARRRRARRSRLKPDDFEVDRTELLTQTATVIMLDLSWSMALRGSFQAAKKVALALNNLISSQFQRDSLYIIGFSAYARELKAEELPYVRWDESVLGTNMHHALMIAQKLLAKHTQGTRQIIMISDGEPTAHLERGRSYFAYPPSPITIRETLKEVKRCTQKNITINTFMLDRNYYLKEFVNQVARINKGRVFYTTPDKLGEYILVDYVAQKKKKLAGIGG